MGIRGRGKVKGDHMGERGHGEAVEKGNQKGLGEKIRHMGIKGEAKVGVAAAKGIGRAAAARAREGPKGGSFRENAITAVSSDTG